MHMLLWVLLVSFVAALAKGSEVVCPDGRHCTTVETLNYTNCVTYSGEGCPMPCTFNSNCVARDVYHPDPCPVVTCTLPPSDVGGLSAGTIVGVVVCVLIVLHGTVLGVYFGVKKYRSTYVRLENVGGDAEEQQQQQGNVGEGAAIPDPNLGGGGGPGDIAGPGVVPPPASHALVPAPEQVGQHAEAAQILGGHADDGEQLDRVESECECLPGDCRFNIVRMVDVEICRLTHINPPLMRHQVICESVYYAANLISQHKVGVIITPDSLLHM